MTREEAIKAIGLMEHVESIVLTYDPGERREDTTVRELKEACRVTAAALRAQQSVKLDRSRWEGCRFCGDEEVVNFLLAKKEKFCPYCGRPLTEEAWAELERRIGGNDETVR